MKDLVEKYKFELDRNQNIYDCKVDFLGIKRNNSIIYGIARNIILIKKKNDYRDETKYNQQNYDFNDYV